MAMLVGGDMPFAMRLAMQMLPGRAKIAHWLVHGLNAAWKMGLFHFGSDADAPVDATDVPPVFGGAAASLALADQIAGGVQTFLLIGSLLTYTNFTTLVAAGEPRCPEVCSCPS